jgi:hypothetical protein
VFHFRKTVKLEEQPKTFIVYDSGENIIGATVWNFGTRTPVAQMSSQTGFVLRGDGESEQGGLQNVKASMPHPKGRIDVSFVVSASGTDAQIGCPEGVPAKLIWRGKTYPLHGGAQTLRLPE